MLGHYFSVDARYCRSFIDNMLCEDYRRKRITHLTLLHVSPGPCLRCSRFFDHEGVPDLPLGMHMRYSSDSTHVSSRAWVTVSLACVLPMARWLPRTTNSTSTIRSAVVHINSIGEHLTPSI